MGGKYSTYRGQERCYRDLVGKPMRRTFRHRWEDNIKQQDMGART